MDGPIETVPSTSTSNEIIDANIEQGNIFLRGINSIWSVLKKIKKTLSESWFFLQYLVAGIIAIFLYISKECEIEKKEVDQPETGYMRHVHIHIFHYLVLFMIIAKDRIKDEEPEKEPDLFSRLLMIGHGTFACSYVAYYSQYFADKSMVEYYILTLGLLSMIAYLLPLDKDEPTLKKQALMTAAAENSESSNGMQIDV